MRLTISGGGCVREILAQIESLWVSHLRYTIPRLNPTVARTKFPCPILGNADTADTLLLTEWLDKLRKVEGHVASLELAHARPTLLPSHRKITREII